MGFSKLREWVETVTGKGDRWGRNREGRSEPAFLSASTIALPPPTCTARREAGQLLAVVFLQGLCRADHLPSVFASSSLVLRALCPPAVACSAGYVCLLLAFAMPTALNVLAPALFILFAPCSFHVRQDRVQTIMFASCKTVP